MVALIAGSLIGFPSAASAYVTSGLLLYLDVTDADSFTDVSSSWNDISPNNADGTFRGVGISYDAATDSLSFPGGSNGTAYVELDSSSGNFDDFSSGLSLEFEADFGTLVNWEAILDMALAVNSTANVIYVGHFYGSSELGVEIYNGGVKEGFCHTSTGSNGATTGNLGTAIGTGFARWTITIGDESGVVKCRIYKDGEELPTRVSISNNGRNTTADAYGTPFVLPATTNRDSAFVGRSNFSANNDFGGKIRSLRVYDLALSESQVAENAGIASPNQVSGSTSPSEPGSPGIFLTVTAEPGRAFEGSDVVFGSYAVAPNSSYQLIVQSISNPSLINQVLATGRVNSGGHLERTIALPRFVAGNYKIILTGTGAGGERLKLTNHVNVDSAGKFTSVSAERLQPLLP